MEQNREKPISVKERLLLLLEQNKGNPLSGQTLADDLGVSRAAIWKAVGVLKSEGHPIDASQSKGYCLPEDSDVLTPEGIRACLPEEMQHRTILVYDAVDSTNTEGKRLLAMGAESGTVILAGRQTAGRGRLGRPFHSPEGTGLYFSLLLRQWSSLETTSKLTIAAAVSTAEAIESLTPLFPQIKWVNDLYLGRKKICGILSEAVTDLESGRIESVVVGIGINVKTPPGGFPPELSKIAGALDTAVSRNALGAALLRRMDFWVQRLGSPDLIQAYRRRSFLPGLEITYQSGGETSSGRAEAIDDDGSLVICRADGTRLHLNAGEVTIRAWK